MGKSNVDNKLCAEQKGFDDLVPVDGRSSFFGQPAQKCHETEVEVVRVLSQLQGVEFANLQVHKIAGGICLSGVLHAQKATDVERVEKTAKACGVERLLNQLVVHVESTGE